MAVAAFQYIYIYTNIHTYIHNITLHNITLHYIHINIYIYIYGRGSRFSDRTSIRIIEFEKKTVFYSGKMEIFDVVHFILDVFQLRIKHLSSVEVEVVDGP